MYRRCSTLIGLLLGLLLPFAVQAQQRYSATGLVLSIDRSRQTMTVSCQEIHGFMDAMVMSFGFTDPGSMGQLKPGALIEFTLVVNNHSSQADDIHIRSYASSERELSKAGRLQDFDEALRGPIHRVAIGEVVPDFTLTDQKHRKVYLRQFAGKVVALNFIYTRCALPDYCVRSSNNFGVLLKQHSERLGRDLVLLTVTFDPVHDQPEVLQSYANTWKADPDNWRFLTGSARDIQRVCDLFGVTFVPDEGLYIHSLHTVIIDRRGKLLANLEGNEFTARQLADLVKTVMLVQ